jgi:hypothetical protein
VTITTAGAAEMQDIDTANFMLPKCKAVIGEGAKSLGNMSIFLDQFPWACS